MTRLDRPRGFARPAHERGVVVEQRRVDLQRADVHDNTVDEWMQNDDVLLLWRE
jgi:hypothetical protein